MSANNLHVERLRSTLATLASGTGASLILAKAPAAVVRLAPGLSETPRIVLLVASLVEPEDANERACWLAVMLHDRSEDPAEGELRLSATDTGLGFGFTVEAWNRAPILEDDLGDVVGILPDKAFIRVQEMIAAHPDSAPEPAPGSRGWLGALAAGIGLGAFVGMAAAPVATRFAAAAILTARRQADLRFARSLGARALRLAGETLFKREITTSNPGLLALRLGLMGLTPSIIGTIAGGLVQKFVFSSAFRGDAAKNEEVERSWLPIVKEGRPILALKLIRSRKYLHVGIEPLAPLEGWTCAVGKAAPQNLTADPLAVSVTTGDTVLVRDGDREAFSITIEPETQDATDTETSSATCVLVHGTDDTRTCAGRIVAGDRAARLTWSASREDILTAIESWASSAGPESPLRVVFREPVMDPRAHDLPSVSGDRSEAIAVIADGVRNASGALILPPVTSADSAREWLAAAGLQMTAGRISALLAAADLLRLARAATLDEIAISCPLLKIESGAPSFILEARANTPG